MQKNAGPCGTTSKTEKYRDEEESGEGRTRRETEAEIPTQELSRTYIQTNKQTNKQTNTITIRWRQGHNGNNRG